MIKIEKKNTCFQNIWLHKFFIRKSELFFIIKTTNSTVKNNFIRVDIFKSDLQNNVKNLYKNL